MGYLFVKDENFPRKLGVLRGKFVRCAWPEALSAEGTNHADRSPRPSLSGGKMKLFPWDVHRKGRGVPNDAPERVEIWAGHGRPIFSGCTMNIL